MSEASDTCAMRHALHSMMKVAFLEIRAAETVHAARKFADIFHGLPMALLNCEKKEDYEAEFKNLLDRAARHGLQDYIRELRRIAMS